MSYTKYEPSGILQDLVNFYYIWERDDFLVVPLDVKGQANGACVLVFNLGDRYMLFNKKFQGINLPRTFLSGFSLIPFSLGLFGKVAIIGVVFKGTVFTSLFKLPPLAELHDTRIDFSFIVGNEAGKVNEQLRNCLDNEQRIEIIEDYFIRKIRKNPIKLDKTDLAINMIDRQKGMIRIDDLTREIECSPRQLRRCFQHKIGIGPKFYARLKRFDYVNTCLSQNPGLSWFDFVDEYGYYDQSHFIKDYLEFTGENPGKFLQNMLETRYEFADVKNQKDSLVNEF